MIEKLVGKRSGYEKKLAKMPVLSVSNKKIAVQLHFYYEDLAKEFVQYLDQIPFSFDLLLTCREEANGAEIAERFQTLRFVNKIQIKKIPNKGRDIAPVCIWFREELKEYDYFLHIHTKKSLFTGQEQSDWRKQCLDAILGSEETIRKIAYLFQENQDIGMVFPEFFSGLTMYHCSWLTNEKGGQAFMKEFGISMENSLFQYPVGSFYWARTDALMPLFDRAYELEEFPEEEGQIDGTLLHVIERGLGLISMKQGYQNVLIDPEEGVARFRKSRKLFRTYCKTGKKELEKAAFSANHLCFDLKDVLVHSAKWRENEAERTEIKKLVNGLHKRGKKLYCAYDAGKKEEEVRQTLAQAGYHPEWFELVAPREEQELPFDLQADCLFITASTFAYWMATYREGRKAVWIMAAKDAFFLSDRFDLEKADFQNITKEQEYKINRKWFSSPFSLKG